MPDQLPSAILDSSNSFDSIFALNLDTKQRFDNILSGIQKPIDYPIPDYNKDFAPQGLPQEDLLNPNITRGSLGEALFSPDPKISSYATDRFRAGQAKLPVNQGIGVPDRFEYSKEMDKYLNGDYGYNPYMSLQDNEDFNYRYDYLNQNVFERVFKNVGTGLTRFVGSVALKLGQSVGYLGSMIGNGVQEIFDSRDNNFMADVADNSLSRWFEGLEENMKNSNLLSVYKPRGWEDKGFFAKLGTGAFWTDEVADGAAFMGEMVASMYLMGGLGRVGGLGRLGATEINLTKAMSKLGAVGNITGKGLDSALKLATGAKDLSGVGRWAFATTSEAAFEASGLYKDRKSRLMSERDAGRNSFTDAEIEKIAGDSAAASFKANMLILSASNAFENRFIFGPLFKKMGLNSPNPRGGAISVSKSTENLNELAKASTDFNYKTWLGKKLNWKSSNSRLRFYGSRALSATAMEGFWEENAQLAAERLASAGELTPTAFFSKISEQTLAALRGEDPEASTSIGLGAVIGGGATAAVAKIRGGNRLFQGERKQRIQDTITAVGIYEQFRKSFLNYQDIYVRDGTGAPIFNADKTPKIDPATGQPMTDGTGKPIMDSYGNLQIDPIKAAGLLDGTNKFLSQQMAADKVSDPLFRKHLQDQAMSDYVIAAKMAGIFGKVVNRFNNLPDIDPDQLTNLGFDPVTTVDSVYLKDSLKAFGQIYDSVQNAPASRLKQGETPEDDEKRKDMLYKSSTGVYSANKLVGEYQSKMADRDFPSVFSQEAEGNTSEVQAYNSLIFQQEALDQFSDMVKEHGDFFDGYLRSEQARINQEKARIKANLDLMQGRTPFIETQRGFYFAPGKYEGYTDTEIDMMLAQENDAQKKHAEYTNIRNQKQYLSNKFSNPETGIKNSKDYLTFIENIQKKDAETDEAQAANPPSTPPVIEAPTVPTPPPAPTVTPPTQQQTIDAQEVLTSLKTMLTREFSAFGRGDEPDFSAIIALIVENQEKHLAAIVNELTDFVQNAATPVTTAIGEGRFERGGTAHTNFSKVAEFVLQIMDTGGEIVDEINDPIADYIDLVVTSIDEYVEPVVELTEAELNAINVLSSLPALVDTEIGIYVRPIIDPNTSNSEKRQALKGLSDQYLDPGTVTDIGSLLGPEGRNAIDALGYDVPTSVTEVPTPTSSAVAERVEQGILGFLVGLMNKQGLPNWPGAIDYVRDDLGLDPDTATLKEIKEAAQARMDQLVAAPTFTITLSPEQRDEIIERIDRLTSMQERGQISLAGEDFELFSRVRQPIVSQSDLDQFNRIYEQMLGEFQAAIDAESLPVQDTQFKGIIRRLNPDPQGSHPIINDPAEVQLAEEEIEQAIQDSSTLDEFAKRVRLLGYTFDLSTRQLLNNFVLARLAGTESRTFGQWRDPSRPTDVGPASTLGAEGEMVIQPPKSLEEALAQIEKNRQASIAAISNYPAEETIGGNVYEAPLTDVYGNPDRTHIFDYATDDPIADLTKEINRYYDEQIQETRSKEFAEYLAETQPVPTQAETATADTEGSGIQPEQPPTPPAPPQPPMPPENSDEAEITSGNFIDEVVDLAKLNGRFVFPQNMPAEVVMEGDEAKITDGAIQLKTTQGPQQRQLLRQHNIIKKMGEKTNPVNFWSEDVDGNPLYKIKLEMAGENRKETFEPWIYNTALGLKDRQGRPYLFPFIVAMVVDQSGKYVYFDDNGNITSSAKGMPFGFVYTVEDYKPENLGLSRRGVQLGTNEALNGEPNYLTDDPLKDITSALKKGVTILGTIEEVTAGKLSTYNVDNSHATWAKTPKQRTIKEMEEAGDITDSATLVLTLGEYFQYSSVTTPGAPSQIVKVGQPYLHDEKSGLKIPLRGKKIKDLTINGQSLITPELRQSIEQLEKEGYIDIPINATEAAYEALENLYTLFRAILYSQQVGVTLSDDKTTITLYDNRENPIPLLETEVNYSSNISVLSNPFELESEGFSYKDFVKENFLSGAVPVELVKGEKSFEKLNRRIIFILDKNHQEILDSTGSRAKTSKTIRVTPTDFNKFVNKTYRRRGDDSSTVTVTGFSNGNFTITGRSGTISQPAADFIKQLGGLEEVKLPDETPEITQEFTERKKLSKDEIADLRERSKNMTDDDLDNLDFSCKKG
jgi:hypothetical protein